MTLGKLPTNHGERNKRQTRVREVESVPCPATLGSEDHELHNNARAETTCLWCGESWAALDAALRGDAA